MRYIVSALIRMSAIFLGVIFALVVLELWLAVSGQIQAPYWTNFTFHEELGWTIKPDLDLSDVEFGYPGTRVDLQTNADGLRTVSPDSIGEDAFVIAVQGDSQTAGFGMDVPNTAVFHLGECLNQQFDQNIQVINFGTNGYDVNQYLTQAQQLGIEYSVDMFVMLLHHTNDFGLAAIKYPYGTYRPYWQVVDNELTLIKPPIPFHQQIYPYQFHDYLSDYNDVLDSWNRSHFTYDPYHPLAWSSLYLQVRRYTWIGGKSDLDVTDAFYEPMIGDWAYVEPIAEPYNSYLPAFQSIMDKWNQTTTHSFVYLLTTEYSVLPEHTTDRNTRLEILGYPESVMSFNNEVSRILDTLDIDFYDSRPEFMAYDDLVDLYLPDDDHFSLLGQEFVGNSLCRQLALVLPRYF